MKVPSVKDLKTITGKGVKSAAEDAVAKMGGVFENDSPTEVLEVLRHFGPEVNPDTPELPR